MVFVKHDEDFEALLLEIRRDHVDLLVVERASLEVLLVVRDIGSVDEDVERSVPLQKFLESPEILHASSVVFLRSYVPSTSKPERCWITCSISSASSIFSAVGSTMRCICFPQ